MQIKVKRLTQKAILPRYATDGAACFDLHADFTGAFFPSTPLVDREESITFRTGISVEVPPGHVMLIFSRSGHGFRAGVRLANCVGVIDSDYRGEIMVKLTGDDALGRLRVDEGDRIAQALIVPIPRVELVEAEELSDTARGTGGLGSTGA